MPRVAIKESRVSLRIRPEDKATLLRAATLKNTDLAAFVLEHALLAAKASD
jgi:uncharacterized protein (DUF1778 family)